MNKQFNSTWKLVVPVAITQSPAKIRRETLSIARIIAERGQNQPGPQSQVLPWAPQGREQENFYWHLFI